MSKRFNPEAALPIELEMAKEKAFALRRTAYVLEKAIDELNQLHAHLAGLSGATRDQKLEQYRTLRAKAEHERWKMIVQREAMGLSHHEDVDRFYPLPPKLKE